MKPEEAVEYNKNLKMYMKISDKQNPCKFLEGNYIALDMAIEALKEQRPHGEWIEKPWGVVCSRCKAQALHTPNGNQSRSDYCPDCGALMRKEEGEAE